MGDQLHQLGHYLRRHHGDDGAGLDKPSCLAESDDPAADDQRLNALQIKENRVGEGHGRSLQGMKSLILI